MLTIKTIEDIHRIRVKGQLPEVFVAELEQYFKDLAEHLTGEKDTWPTFNLQLDCPILALQPGVDDPGNLGAYGMTKDYDGIYGAPIEFTDLLDLEGISLFKTVLVLDNDYCLTIFSEVGRFGREFDDYLLEHMAVQEVT